ncbi:MAG: trypsin-like peptidase domain-containing protein [bacterium]
MSDPNSTVARVKPAGIDPNPHAQGKPGEDISFSPTEKNVSFLKDTMGLDVTVPEDGLGHISAKDYEAYGSLLPDVSRNMPWGTDFYLEEQEMAYLKILVNYVADSKDENRKKEKILGMKKLLHDLCWGQRHAYTNLFSRTYFEPTLPPYEGCAYDDIPKELDPWAPILGRAPVPLTALRNFACSDVERSMLKLSYTYAVCHPDESDLGSGTAIVIDKEGGLLLTARHMFKEPVEGVTHITFEGPGGDFEVSISDIEAALPDGERDWMVLRLKNRTLLENYADITFSSAALARDQYVGNYYSMGYGKYFDSENTTFIPSAVRLLWFGDESHLGRLIAGMSGGPMVTESCELAAINVAHHLYMGVSYAHWITRSEVDAITAHRFQPLKNVIPWQELDCCETRQTE